MKYPNTNTQNFSSSSSIKENSSKKQPPFPKIQKIQKDEKKKKKTDKDCDPHCPIAPNKQTLFLQLLSSKNKYTHSIKELSTPIVNTITMAKNKEETKTTFSIKTTLFDEIDISIITYSFAPHHIHIKLFGNQSLQNISQQQQQLLLAELKKNLPNTKIHLSPPLLRKKERLPTKKKKLIVQTHQNCYGNSNEG